MKYSVFVLSVLLCLSAVSCGSRTEKEEQESTSGQTGKDTVQTEPASSPGTDTEPPAVPETESAAEPETVPETEPVTVPDLPDLYPDPAVTEPVTAEEPIDGAPVVIIPDSGSGRFTSEGNKNLKLCVDWSYTLNPDRVYGYDVTLSVSLSHYELYAGAKLDAGIVTFADSGTLEGNAYSFSTPAISYDGEERTETLLFEKTYSMDFAHAPVSSIPVSVVWDIQIAYGGEQIDALTAEGVIPLEGKTIPIG